MALTRAQVDSVKELRTHILYIREKTDELNARTKEDANRLADHEKADNERFDKINAKINKFVGGLLLAAALAGFLTRVVLG